MYAYMVWLTLPTRPPTHTAHSPELQKALLLSYWPGLGPFVRASLDPSSPSPSAPALVAHRQSAADPTTTPLAPLLHLATTAAQRRAEEERRLAERFRDEALRIEVRAWLTMRLGVVWCDRIGRDPPAIPRRGGLR